MQERCNSSALAMELLLSCINPSIYSMIYSYPKQAAIQSCFNKIIFSTILTTEASLLIQEAEICQGSTLRRARVPRACRSCARAHKLLWLGARLGK